MAKTRITRSNFQHKYFNVYNLDTSSTAQDIGAALCKIFIKLYIRILLCMYKYVSIHL